MLDAFARPDLREDVVKPLGGSLLTMQFRLRKLDVDEYDAPHVEVSVSGSGFAARQDSYIEDDEWVEFGTALKAFPQHLEHEVTFENGAREGKYYCYILLRALVYDGLGHSALEVKISNHLTPPHSAAAHFYIQCEAAALNRLGESLEKISTRFSVPANFSIEVNINHAGHSSYNGLQVGLRRRFTKGLGFGLAYTFSKVIDNASDKRDRLFNAYDDHGFRSVSNFDRAHIFNVHYIYELPFWRSQNTLLKKVVGGWQVSGVTYFVTGAPLTVCRGDDIAGVGDTECQPWNLAGDINVPNPSFSNGIKVDQNLWFNPSAFVRPASGRFGNAGRNIIRGPSQQSWDIALFKNFPVTENTKVQFRSEFFNFPNHPNLNNPNTDPTSSEFGRILGKTGERNIQFALKFLF